MANTVKALRVEIYEGKSIGNCSNDGISARYKDILLIHEEGYIDVDLDNPPENACKVVTRFLFGRYYKHIEPLKPVEKGNVGYMAGGSFAYCCDSRFGDISDYPLPIHDRQETQEQYDALSH